VLIQLVFGQISFPLFQLCFQLWFKNVLFVYLFFYGNNIILKENSGVKSTFGLITHCYLANRYQK